MSHHWFNLHREVRNHFLIKTKNITKEEGLWLEINFLLNLISQCQVKMLQSGNGFPVHSSDVCSGWDWVRARSLDLTLVSNTEDKDPSTQPSSLPFKSTLACGPGTHYTWDLREWGWEKKRKNWAAPLIMFRHRHYKLQSGITYMIRWEGWIACVCVTWKNGPKRENLRKAWIKADIAHPNLGQEGSTSTKASSTDAVPPRKQTAAASFHLDTETSFLFSRILSDNELTELHEDTFEGLISIQHL